MALTVLAFCCFFFACSGHGIDLVATNLTLHIGEEARINAVSDEKLTFQSEDENIAIVNEYGVVKAIGEGQANIIISNEWQLKRISVHVVPAEPAETSSR